VRFPQEFFQGSLHLEVAWNGEDGTAHAHTVDVPIGTPLNTTTAPDQPVTEPELVKALMAPLKLHETKRGQIGKPLPDAADGRSKMVIEAVKHVYARLQEGLGAYWYAMGPDTRSPDGKHALSEIPPARLNELTPQELDECWAQHLTEMVAGTCYQGPGVFHDAEEQKVPGALAQHNKDAKFNTLVRQRAEKGDLIFSLVYACQQMATATVMSRSASFYTLADDPFDCGCSKPFGKMPGDAVKEVGHEDVDRTKDAPLKGDYESLKKESWLTPGTVFFKRSTSRHCSAAIRIFRNGKIQLIDTGAWNIGENPFPKAKVPANESIGKGINFDTEGAKALPNPLFSVCVPPPVARDDLTKAIGLLIKSRSVGSARLLVLIRGNGEYGQAYRNRVLWVSPRVLLYEKTPSFRHYPITRLVAALRGCPHFDVIEARWQLMAPLHEQALEAAMLIPKKETPDVEPGETRWWEAQRAEQLVAELAVSQNGTPTVIKRTRQTAAVQSFDDGLKEIEKTKNMSKFRTQKGSPFPNLLDVSDDNLPAFFSRSGVGE
jgi:hypothetical protein